MIWGQKIHIIINNIYAPTKGSTSLNTFSNGVFVMPAMLNTKVPTGGVQAPTVVFKTIITPITLGSTPTDKAIGTNTGANRVMFTNASKKDPFSTVIR